MDSRLMTPASGQESSLPRDKRTPVVSVIIPHLDDVENLERCITLLQAQSFPAESTEIVVVDNGSKVGFESICSIVGVRAKTVRADRKGAGLARNAGVTASRGSILAFIDSDCRPDPDWIVEGVAALASHDLVGGTVRVDVADPDNMTPTEAFEVVFAFRNAMYIRSKGFTVTASMFVRRDVFDEVGPFRVGVSEDVDWCHRARKLGYRLGYAPSAVVGHPARRTWAELKGKARRLTSEAYGLYREIPFGRALWLGWTWVLPLSVIPHLGHVLTTRKLSSVRDRLNAAQILLRIRLLRFVDGNRIVLTNNSQLT
jgi:glycosyltransferase involved in cell wall biosynthesis